MSMMSPLTAGFWTHTSQNRRFDAFWLLLECREDIDVRWILLEVLLGFLSRMWLC